MSDFTDDAFVYVDPMNRKVIGPVEWGKNGDVLKKEMALPERKEKEGEDKGRPKIRRKPRKRFYPWCSFKTARKVYNVEGKFKEEEPVRTFDETLQRALKEPYWND